MPAIEHCDGYDNDNLIEIVQLKLTKLLYCIVGILFSEIWCMLFSPFCSWQVLKTLYFIQFRFHRASGFSRCGFNDLVPAIPIDISAYFISNMRKHMRSALIQSI